ncbi:phage antirepressor KilAC domain-containing protein [Corynebacterium pseudodiphtheriticum]|uniref:phage antirepressor KilAC domain-containing protein n=1 Tax=Corynebacterium pseudodiphtheriticum TaxID=37637 RepID=UPI0020C07CEE|nr:phage antirepressor KilAC domain-containing protein [Corynebacterium pseudodiphtheriticum]UQV55758.1 phage antirepressor KilAC domain-containing protein [Corynebacterium pseudodiphtheriticum]
MDNDEFLEHAIVHLRSERAKRLAAEQALLEVAPKVSYYDVVLQSDSLLTITEIAKRLWIVGKEAELAAARRWSSVQAVRPLVSLHPLRGAGLHAVQDARVRRGLHRTHMYWTQEGRLFVYYWLKNESGVLPVIEQDGGAA